MPNNNDATNEVYKAVVGVASKISEIPEVLADQIKQAMEDIARARYQTNKALLSARLEGTTSIPSLEKAQAFSDSLIPIANSLNDIEKDLLNHNKDIKQLNAQALLIGNQDVDPNFAKQFALGQDKVLAQTYTVNELALKSQKELSQLVALTADAKNMDPAALAKAKDNLSNTLTQLSEANQTMKVTLKEQSDLAKSAGLGKDKSDVTPNEPKTPRLGSGG